MTIKMRHFFKSLVIAIALFSCVSGMYGQVTIGSDITPERAALLDIKEEFSQSHGMGVVKKGGLLLPKIELEDLTKLEPFISESEADYAAQKKKHTGLMVYNLKIDKAKKLEEGVYVWDGTRWKISGEKEEAVKFFYMPSFVIDTSVPGTGAINLYDEYLKQFGRPAIASKDAPLSIPVYTHESLYYYVTSYDTDVFSSIKISERGVMEYTIQNQATATSVINIVFVIKE